jgi:phosphoglycerol transferase MdoB-like AlkP superfamily enzyme
MGVSYWQALLPPIVAGIVASFLIEVACRPRPASPWRRPASATTIHCACWILVFTAELATFRRPWFASCSVNALFVALTLVNNAKYQSLREPFLFQDFEYFRDAIRHPRLYLPFLGFWRFAFAVASIATVLVLGLRLETPVTDTTTHTGFFTSLCALALFAGVSCRLAARSLPRVGHDPVADLRHMGFLAFLWRYGIDERGMYQPGRRDPVFVPRSGRPKVAPHMVAVQNESFFDPRRTFANVRPSVLRHFDALKERASAFGPLQVPTWGANTVRTEFAFLSGLAPQSLGVHRFNPYRRFARSGVGTIASFLKTMGYRTVCIHPYPASFYFRDIVYPALGFDQFIDIRGFDPAQKFGPFISDDAVAERILGTLDEAGSGQPTFVFAITMENHGPLHLESAAPGEAERFLTTRSPDGCDDLTVYLRHLTNADGMIDTLQHGLSALAEPAGLCFFGDHVPIMTRVYDSMGYPDGHTEYLVWKVGSAASSAPRPLVTEDLAVCFLTHMGWS